MPTSYRNIPVIDASDPIPTISGTSLALARYIDENLLSKREAFNGIKGEKGDTGDVTPAARAAAQTATSKANEATAAAKRATDAAGALTSQLETMQQALPNKADLVNGKVPNTQLNLSISNSSNSIAQRDGSGRLHTTSPTAAAHAANKTYVDNAVNARPTTAEVDEKIGTAISQLPPQNYQVGTTVQRNEFVGAPYFSLFQTTDSAKQLFWSDGKGRWQPVYFKHNLNPGALSASPPIYYKSIVISLPVILSASESIALISVNTPARFGAASILSTEKQTNQTVVTVGYTQFANGTAVDISFIFQVIPLA